MTDAQTEARAIARLEYVYGSDGYALRPDAGGRYVLYDDHVTALEAKAAELAALQASWCKLDDTANEWANRAHIAEAALAEARKALEHLADTANAILGANPYDEDAQEAFEMFNIARDQARTIARRALTGGQDNG